MTGRHRRRGMLRAQLDQLRTAARQRGPDVVPELFHAQPGRADQHSDIVDEPQPGGDLVAHDHVDASHAERCRAGELQAHGTDARERVAVALVQAKLAAGIGGSNESARVERGPQPLVGRCLQRGPRPELLGVHADHVDLGPAASDLGAVERERLGDPVDLADPGEAGVADPARLDHGEVGQDDPVERRGGLGRASVHVPDRRAGNVVQQAAGHRDHHGAVGRRAPPRGAADGSRVWRSAPPKATHSVVHHNRGPVIYEEGTPYFPVKDLVVPYLTKPGGNIRLR